MRSRKLFLVKCDCEFGMSLIPALLRSFGRVLIEGVKYYADQPRMLGKTFLRLVSILIKKKAKKKFKTMKLLLKILKYLLIFTNLFFFISFKYFNCFLFNREIKKIFEFQQFITKYCFLFLKNKRKC